MKIRMFSELTADERERMERVMTLRSRIMATEPGHSVGIFETETLEDAELGRFDDVVQEVDDGPF